ncbi:MAG TPA: Rieske (2Fe-2S) protein [Pseudonocardiaceae bacterium]|nr:Rieske (2Fe-2S) protein [Pseudonocardiaceae bacterium]
MSARGARRFIADLLRGRRPRSFRADDTDAGQLRAAITLRAGQPGSAVPREQFVTDLHRRLADELTPEPAEALQTRPRRAVDGTRRRLVQATSLAAAAAAVGAVADHALTSRGPAPAGGGEQTLVPTTGQWRTVSASAELTEGAVRSFDIGTVVGFVARSGGALRAVSGVCTHLGCRLALDAPARRLDCPCHNTSFALSGELIAHQLPTPPPPLPQLEVREAHGEVQIFAPPGSV